MPVQCPECARFLSGAFVAGLQKGPAPCPKCGTSLGAHQFSDTDDDATVEPGTPLPETSVRPPDLSPVEVRDDVVEQDLAPASDDGPGAVPDPLAGWDRPDNVFPLTPSRASAMHAPPAAVAIGVGAAIGGLLGAVIADRSVRGSILGGSIGAAAGAAAVRSMAQKNAVDLIE